MKQDENILIIESACELIDIIMTTIHKHPENTEASIQLWVNDISSTVGAVSSINTSRINEVSLDDPQSMYEIGFFSCINFIYDSGRLSLKNDGQWKEDLWVGVDGLKNFITKGDENVLVKCDFDWKESFGHGSPEHERFIHHLNILKL